VSEAPTGRRRAAVWARRVYMAALAVVVVVAVVSSRADLARLLDGSRPLWLLAALLLTFGQLWLAAAFTTAALRGFGTPVPLSRVLSISVRTLPARYLPGSIWYPLGRAGLLATEERVGKRVAAGVIGLETVLSVVVGFCLGGALLAGSGRLPAGTPLAMAVSIVMFVALSPPVLNPILARVRPGTPAVTWPLYGVLVVLMAAFWALCAAAFVVYLAAFPQVELAGPFTIAGAFLVAWAVGFLAVFAPQGIGVFEVTVAALLTVPDTAAVALIVAAFRALIGIRDLAAFGVAGLPWARRGPAIR